jgi:hypothetical protein
VAAAVAVVVSLDGVCGVMGWDEEEEDVDACACRVANGKESSIA